MTTFVIGVPSLPATNRPRSLLNREGTPPSSSATPSTTFGYSPSSGGACPWQTTSFSDVPYIGGGNGANGIGDTVPVNATGTTTLDLAVPWEIDYATQGTQPGTLTVSLRHSGTTPLARCDVYWAHPYRILHVAAPGVLRNDESGGHGKLTPIVDHISFGISSHPYALESDGAVVFRTTKPGTARITYHVVAADGAVSPSTTATIVVSNKRPRLAMCAGSGGSSDSQRVNKQNANPGQGSGGGGTGGPSTGPSTKPYAEGGFAMDCGIARVDMYQASSRVAYKGDRICAMLDSSGLAQSILSDAFTDQDLSYTQVLGAYLANAYLIDVRADTADEASQKVADLVHDKLGPKELARSAASDWVVQQTMPKLVQEVLGVLGDFDDVNAYALFSLIPGAAVTQSLFDDAVDADGSCTGQILDDHKGKVTFTTNTLVLNPKTAKLKKSQLYQANLTVNTSASGGHRLWFRLACDPAVGECPRNCVGMNERDAHAFNPRREVL